MIFIIINISNSKHFNSKRNLIANADINRYQKRNLKKKKNVYFKNNELLLNC